MLGDAVDLIKMDSWRQSFNRLNGVSSDFMPENVNLLMRGCISDNTIKFLWLTSRLSSILIILCKLFIELMSGNKTNIDSA